MTTPRFSLLLPVYAGDDAEQFSQAFASAVEEQTLRPDQVVLVQDGPVGDDLAAAIAAAVEGCAVPVEHVVIEQNGGLAAALTLGLKHCAHDIVARMDADDISLPERFARQLPVMAEGYDLVGTGMYEFDRLGRIGFTRTPPVGSEAIAAYARFHDPFNHPTVVYRRSVVEAAGGYRDLPLMEDYWLFARMIHHGARVQNIPDPLVMYRVDAGAYARRGGRRLFASELRLQRILLREGFIGPARYLRNVLVRGGYRFVPVVARKWAYRRMVAHRGEEGASRERAERHDRIEGDDSGG